MSNYQRVSSIFIAASLSATAGQGTMDRKMTETNDSVCKSQADSSLDKSPKRRNSA